MTQAANLAALGTFANSSGQVSLATGVTGTLAKASMPVGSVIQTQTAISGFNSNITVSNPSGGQNALYNTGVPSRVYVDLTSITITPTFSTSKFLVFSTSGLTSGTNTNNGAFGTVLVINNSTGIGFGGDFPWYPTLTSLNNSYPPDSAMNAYYSPGSASAFTVYLKGYAYSEGSNQITNFRNVVLTVLEILQ